MASKKHPVQQLLDRKSGRIKLRDIYKVRLGKRQGQQVWLVDGARVCQEIYPAFVMGGNDQRYRFNPLNEIWIDNRIGVEELEYTIAHELIERKLMKEKGWSYDRAHSEGGLEKERQLRVRQEARVAKKERSLTGAKFGDWHENLPREVARLRVCLDGVYRLYHGKVDGLAVWIVDGNKVRRDIHADFCFGGTDKEYFFIPPGEIWIDCAISVEEFPFTLLHQRSQRKFMASGKPYDDAYPAALIVQYEERVRQENLVKAHEEELPPVRYGVRERGVKR